MADSGPGILQHADSDRQYLRWIITTVCVLYNILMCMVFENVCVRNIVFFIKGSHLCR